MSGELMGSRLLPLPGSPPRGLPHSTISELPRNQFHAFAASVSWAEATTPVPYVLHHTFVTNGVPVRTQARSPLVCPPLVHGLDCPRPASHRPNLLAAMVFLVVVMKWVMSVSLSNCRKPTRLESLPELQVI